MPKSPTYRTRPRWTVNEARAALDAVAASGLSLTAFAAREKLNVQRFRFWQKRLKRKRSKTPSFVELRPREPERLELVLRSGRMLRFASSIDRDELAALVRVLDDAC
jgi:hypothetical protein